MSTTSSPASTEPAIWQRLRDLPLTVDAASTAQRELEGGTAFTRITTEVVLQGAGQAGRGEDAAYSPDTQRALPVHFATLDLAGSWTLASFSERLDTLQLTPAGDQWDDHPNYHRWAFESAALDLALRQAGRSFAEAVGEAARPLNVCISMGLGSPPDVSRVQGWLAAHPSLTFKLDASAEWTDDTVRALADTGAVRVVDIKGMYEGDWIDNTPNPALYARIAAGLPEALIEDPKLREETREALGADGLARVTWDAPLHSLADLLAADAVPAAVNIKPSRFGSTRELLAVIEYCQTQGLPLYSGGQFELGYGRTQAQTLAAVFFADAANDIAPAVWHTAKPGDTVPLPPVLVPDGPGFGWEVIA